MKELVKAFNVIEAFRMQDDQMPTQRVATFLLVAMRGKVTREIVASELGQSPPSAYRNLMALSDQPYSINAMRKQGLGLLTFANDPCEPRRLVWELSPKGKRMVEQMREIKEQALPSKPLR